MDFNNFLNERRITVKRRYTENHPAVEVGQSARVRNKILETIADGSITVEEFEKLVSELSNDSSRWSKRNSRYFNVSEEGVSLTQFGKKILKSITVNEALINEEKTASEKLADEVSGELYKATLRGNSATVTATTTTQMWDDGVPVLKYLARGKGKPVKMEKKVFNVIHDVAHGWFYFSDGRKWFGLHMSDGYYDPSDLPFDVEIAESVDEKTTKNPEVWVPGEFDKAVSKLKFNQITREKIIELAKKYDVGVHDAIAYVEFGWSLDLTENNNIEMGDKLVYESFTEFVGEVLNEGKRQRNAVVKAWVKTKLTDMKAIAKLYSDAMEDANFHTEMSTAKAIGAASQAKRAMLQGLDGSDISAAASWDGYAIANGTVDFLRTIGQEGAADKLYAAISKFGLNESIEVLESLAQSEEMVTEAFKSSKLQNLINMGQSGSDTYGNKASKLAPAIYGLSKIKLDQVEDSALMDVDASRAYKQYANNNDYLVFYIVDNEKENPYASSDTYRGSNLKPGILAVTRGKDFLGVNYYSARGFGKNKRHEPSLDAKAGPIGGNKNYRGYDASGLSSIKRVAELADRAIVFNLIAGGESARDLIKSRVDARSGAVAFQSADDFKKANKQRYQDILATKAAALPLDKIVEEAIDILAKQIADAVKSGNVTRYGEIKIGEDKKGREIKVTDASNMMSNILSDYQNYVSYTTSAEKEKAGGYSSGYYEKNAKEYAKAVSDRVSKVKNMDYAW